MGELLKPLTVLILTSKNPKHLFYTAGGRFAGQLRVSEIVWVPHLLHMHYVFNQHFSFVLI